MRIAAGMYVGIPFRDRGCGREGCDCWGLVRLVYADGGVELPDYPISAFDDEGIGREVARQQACWHRVRSPQAGDVVLISSRPGVLNHVGVYLGRGRFLHTLAKTGAAVVSVEHPVWKRKIKGFYRWAT